MTRLLDARLMRQALVGLALAASIAGCHHEAARPGRRALGLELGEATAHDVVLTLGDPTWVSLSGSDGEGGVVAASDSLVFLYHLPLPELGGHMAAVRVFVSASDQHVHAISAEPIAETTREPVRVSVQRVLDQLGTPTRVVRVQLIPRPGDMELVLARCSSPEGEVRVLIYEERALEIVGSASEAGSGIQRLRFADEIGAAGYLPPCQ